MQYLLEITILQTLSVNRFMDRKKEIGNYLFTRSDKMIEYKMNVLSALKEKGYNTNRLRKEKLLSESTIQQLRENKIVSWNNIDRLCKLLECQVGDIVEHVKEP